MSASDNTAGQRQPDVTETATPRVQEGSSFTSLTRTLEDLEARLSRLSTVRATTTERSAPPPQPKAPTPDADAAFASRTAVPRPAKPSPLDRRFGTIAGEIEALQMQGATLRLMNDVASDLQSLRSEIRDGASGEAQFEEVRTAFLDLRQLIETREDKGRIGTEIALILDRLSNLQAGQDDQEGIETLRAELDGIGGLVSQMAREETLASVNRRWDEFETRLSEQVELDNAAKRDLRAELERLRDSVRSLATDEQIRAVEARWTEFEESYLDDVREQTEEQLTRLIKGDLDALRARLDELAQAPVPAAVQARLDSLEGVSAAALDAGFERLSQRIGEVEATLVTLPDLGSIERLDQRMRGLVAAVEAIAARQDDPDLEHFIVLEERLDEISQAIVASALREANGLDMAPIERIEARIADLAARVDTLTSEGKADLLSERIAELSSRIDGLAAAPHAMDEQLEAATQRFEMLLAEHRPHAPDLSGIEERIEALSQRLDAQPAAVIDADAARSLGLQIEALSAQLNGRSEGVDVDGNLEQRMAAVERRLDENREELLMVARAAADEAVRLVGTDGSSRETVHVLQLSDDLRKLEALSRESDERSLTVFQAVHSTLVRVAERLEMIEVDLAQQSGPRMRSVPAAPVAEERPDLRASVAPVFAATAMPAFADDMSAAVAPAEPAIPTDESPRGLRGAINRRLQSRRDRKTAAAEETGETGETGSDDLDASMAASLDAARSTVTGEADRALVDAPSLDAADSIVSREANRPLEPGSGAPDIASLIERVRQQQLAADRTGERQNAKSDFIAAARKAAMAAAVEADALRDLPETTDEAGAADRVAKRRKPILMAVGAVLLAMMAVPFGRTMLQEDGPVLASGPLDEQAEIDPVVTATVAPTSTARPAAERTMPLPAQRPEILESTVAEAIRPAMNADETQVMETDRMTVAELETKTAELAVPAAYQPRPATPAPVLPDPRVEAIANAVPAPTPLDALRARALAKLPNAVGDALPAAPAQIGSTALVAAAEGGDAKAMFEIGLRLMEGHGAEPKLEDAFLWFTHAAKRGFVPAQYSVGNMLEKGNGVARLTPAARDWYLLAAKAGNVRAMHNLAVLYATGIEGAPQPETSARWFTAAAEHGMRDSQYNLGILYARGAGVPQDLEQSFRWFSIVAAAGDTDARSKRDTIGESLAEADRTRLEAEAAAFQPAEAKAFANAVAIPPEWAEPAEQTASVSPAPVDVTRAIRNVQTLLGKLGFDAGTPDGVVGEQTTQAVRDFQKQSGLNETGVIDADLIRALLKKQDA